MASPYIPCITTLPWLWHSCTCSPEQVSNHQNPTFPAAMIAIMAPCMSRGVCHQLQQQRQLRSGSKRLQLCCCGPCILQKMSPPTPAVISSRGNWSSLGLYRSWNLDMESGARLNVKRSVKQGVCEGKGLLGRVHAGSHTIC